MQNLFYGRIIISYKQMNMIKELVEVMQPDATVHVYRGRLYINGDVVK